MKEEKKKGWSMEEREEGSKGRILKLSKKGKKDSRKKI